MKALALILSSITQPLRKRNVRVVVWLTIGLLVLVAIYSTIFHEIMSSEGRSYSWATGIYWTLTVMSTLGFGDITFESDAGRIFSVVVLISGATFILVLLPFAFIQFIFLPWIASRDARRTRRRLDPSFEEHVIITKLDSVTDAVIRRLQKMKVRYVLITPDPNEALTLYERGYEVMVGQLDDPATYEAARAEHAAMVVTTQSDMANANIAFTVSELDPSVNVVATASNRAAYDVLVKAGCDTVIQLGDLLGNAMARRVLGRDGKTTVVGSLDDLLVAEAAVTSDALAGRTVAQTRLRTLCNVNIAGIWRHGRFVLADPDLVIEELDVLILIGSREQLDRYDAAFGSEVPVPSHIIIAGGGRVGRAAARALVERGVGCKIIEVQQERIRDPELYVLGDASQLEVLEAAGLDHAQSILVTTHDDDFNVFLTIYCGQIAPDLPVVARSNKERNVATLKRAGAEFVLSYASLGATEVINCLGDNDSLVLVEGLEVISTPLPRAMVNRSLTQARVRELTGCNVIGVTHGGHTITNPDPDQPLDKGSSLVLIGDSDAQARFFDRFPADPRLRIVRRRPARKAQTPG